MKKHLLIISFLLLTGIIFAQSAKLDSLRGHLTETNDTLNLKIYNEIGDYYSKTNLDSAMVNFGTAMSFSKNKADSFLVYDHIRGAYFTNRNFDSLAVYNKILLTLSREINDSVSITRFLSEVGKDYSDIGEYVKAAVMFKESKNIHMILNKFPEKKKLFNPYAIALLNNNIGVVYAHKGQFDTAIYYMLESIKEKELLKVDEGKLLPSWNNLAALAFRKKDYDRALEFINNCLDISLRQNDTLYLGYSYNKLGATYKYLEEYDKAIEFYEKSLLLARATNNIKSQGNVLGNLGVLYLEVKDSVRAKKHIVNALSYSKGAKDKSTLASNFTKMAYYYYDHKDYDSAIILAQSSLKLAHEIEYRVLEELNNKVLHESYAKKNMFDSAYKAAILYMEYHDGFIEKESNENYQELMAKYEAAEKGKRILEQDIEVEKRKAKQIQTYWIGGGIALIFVFIIILILLKRRKDNIINEQEQLVLKKEKALSDSNLEKSKLQEQELKNEVQYKSKQLTTHALNMMQKNTLMQEIQEELIVISKKANAENKPVLNRIKMLIKKNLRSEKDWDLFKLYFEDVNKQFYKDLAEINTDLTSNDLKLCALLKLNMNIKESASVLNIEPASVKTARYKLRKKLALKPEDDLVEVIRKIG